MIQSSNATQGTEGIKGCGGGGSYYTLGCKLIKLSTENITAHFKCTLCLSCLIFSGVVRILIHKG